MRIRILAGAVLGGAFLASTAAIAEPGVSADKVLLGGTNAVTGPVAAVCLAVTQGAQAWFDKVNAAGGVHGRAIEYTVLDDGYSAQRAVGNTRRLIQQDNVFAMFGGCGTATAAGVLSFLKSQPDVPYLFPYAGLTELIEPVKKAHFALVPLYDQQLSTILPFIYDKMQTKPKSGAVLSSNIAGADAWRQAVRDFYEAHDIELVYDELMEVTAPERSTFVVQLKAKDPDFVVVADSAPGSARVYLEMKRQNWKPKMTTGLATLTAEQFLTQVADVVQGIMIAPGFVVPPTDDAAKACNEALVASYSDLQPNHFSVYGCASAIVFVEALQRAGKDLTREGLITALESMDNFKTGVSGPVTFTADDHMGLHSVIPFGVRDGNYYVMSEPLSSAK